MPAMNPPIPTAACVKCGVLTNDIQYVGGIICKQCWNNQQEKQIVYPTNR